MIEFWLKNSPNFLWNYGDGMLRVREQVFSCIKKWRNQGANTEVIEVRSANDRFSGSVREYIKGIPVIYVSCEKFTGVEEVTIILLDWILRVIVTGLSKYKRIEL